jgi:hypothetical protein
LDHARYGTIKRELQNKCAKGMKTHYPQTIVEAYNFALNYRSDKMEAPNNNKTTGLSFNMLLATNVERKATTHQTAWLQQ